MYVVQSFIVALGIIVLSIGCSNNTGCSDYESSQSQSYSPSDESNSKLQNSTSKNSETKTEEVAESSSSSTQEKEAEKYPLEKYTFTDASGLNFTMTLNPDKTATLDCNSRNITYYGNWYFNFKERRSICFSSDKPDITFPNNGAWFSCFILTSDNFLYSDEFAADAKNPKARFKAKKVQ